MYQTPYMSSYNPQVSIDRINTQIAELEKMKSQIQQPVASQPAINQTFQLAPTNANTIRYANSVAEVQKDIVIGDTPYFSKDFSVLWVKNTKGEIKAYELTEIVEKDEKDIQIDYLMGEIQKLKGMIDNEQSDTNDDKQDVSTNATENGRAIRTATKEGKSTNVQRISTSKTK